MQPGNLMNRFTIFKQRRVKVAAMLLALAAGIVLWLGRSTPPASVTMFAARRGPLQITVLEGGSIEAREAQEVRSEIKDRQGTKILSIVEEGYLVTEADVKNGKVLVELDSSDLKQRMTQQDIQYQSSLASYIDAQQSLAIQINQNKSDIKMAEQKAKFALMDLEKYMGDVATKEILGRLGLPYDVFTNETSDVEQTLLNSVNNPNFALGHAVPEPGKEGQPRTEGPAFPVSGIDSTNEWLNATRAASPAPEGSSPPAPKRRLDSLTFDFGDYVNEERLGDGAAKQSLRKLKDDLYVAETDLNVAKTKRDGTRRLHEAKFVTKTELENDEIAVRKNELRMQTAQTALELFRKYEFAKTAEEALSKYEEALQGLDRARKEAVSRLAQSRARFRSAEGQFRIQEEQLKELREQLGKCIITAKKPGLVVYGGNNNQRYYNSEEQIREGATVRERQSILTIPDMSQMSVKVKIPEAHIKKVKKGMKARVQVEAFPDEELTGEVTKVGVLPDSQDRWLNPDLKVYLTTVSIHGSHDWVKPGMTAKVDIQVKQLEDVVYVPLQAIFPDDGKHYCYVGKGPSPERREVQIGDFNGEFIAVTQGIQESEVVRLRLPELPLEAEPENDTPAEPETPAAAPNSGKEIPANKPLKTAAVL